MDLHRHLQIAALFLLMRWGSLTERRCADGRFGDSCMLDCRCANDINCDDVTGTCTAGCAAGWSGTACQRKNIAYSIPATMRVSSNITVGGVATDGDVTTCVTSRANKTGWWKMELPTLKRVYSMRIDTGNTSFKSWGVYVSEYDNLFWTPPCTTLRYSGSQTYLTCDKPMTGRYVGVMNKAGPVTLCQLEVFACADYTYGEEDCASRCRCQDKLEICDRVFGTCITGCSEGWTGTNCNQACNNTYGQNCIHRCGHCLEGTVCDVSSGRCPRGCSAGWSGPTCHAKCAAGWHGDNCTRLCGHCRDGSTCSSVTGNCVKGCAVGWKESKCDTMCQYGEYGADCSLKCGHCARGSGCDSLAGICGSGCDQGWEGLFCTQECLPGHYGGNCTRSCGKCITQPCERHNGSCGQDGCLQGWSGDRCSLACKSGFYGPNCDKACGHCIGLDVCDPMEGQCGGQCDPGYHGDTCSDVCSGGTWGANCSEVCGLCHENKDCNPVTGLCDEGCFVKYSGTYCKEAEEFLDLSSALVMPVMSISVAILVFSLCLLFVCLVLKWRRDKEEIPHAVMETKMALLSSSRTTENHVVEV